MNSYKYIKKYINMVSQHLTSSIEFGGVCVCVRCGQVCACFNQAVVELHEAEKQKQLILFRASLGSVNIEPPKITLTWHDVN